MQETTLAPHALPPLAETIIDRAIDNVNRKLVAGYRNKRNSRPNAKQVDIDVVVSDTLAATSAQSVMDVANRGGAWREMIEKSLSHGISSLSTLKFDGEFKIENGVPTGLKDVPNQPGVYVVFDKNEKPVYVGDAAKLQKRWHSGHLNEHRQGERQGTPYKLAEPFAEGCTVRYVVMESVETAAAVEAHFIRTEPDLINAREELLTEQGKRSNIEAKKMKDASGSTASLAGHAALAGLEHSAWQLFEQLTATVIKALKDELVAVFRADKTPLLERVKRFALKIWHVIERIISAPVSLLAGLFEFIVNALSKTISQIYGLARNIFDLGQSAWQLYKGAETMSTDELVHKITETVVVSGTLVVWDMLDPVLEAQLTALVGPVAPYLSASLCAIGFGLSSYYLQQLVPGVVRALVSLKNGAHDVWIAQKAACEQMIVVHENEIALVQALKDSVVSAAALERDLIQHTVALRPHTPVRPLDLDSLLNN